MDDRSGIGADRRTAPPRSAGRRKGLAILAAIVTVSAVALALTYALAGCIQTTECPSYHYGDPSHFGMAVVRNAENWTATVVSSQRGYHHDSTFVQVRTPTGGILMDRNAWSNLTTAGWPLNHIVYEDSRPLTPYICEGDRLVIDVFAFARESRLLVFAGETMIGSAILY